MITSLRVQRIRPKYTPLRPSVEGAPGSRRAVSGWRAPLSQLPLRAHLHYTRTHNDRNPGSQEARPMFAPRASSTLVRALLVALLALSMAIAVVLVEAHPFAQEALPMRYGETVTGTLSEVVPCQFYTFEGAAGDPVTIDMRRTSGDLDGVLTLFQGAGDIGTASSLAENDDRPNGGLDPLIAATLPESGVYTIAACRLQAPQMRVTTGSYALTLTGPEASGGSPPTPAAPLSGGVFGDSGTPTPTAPTAEPALAPGPSPTPASPLLQMLTGDGTLPVLIPGEPTEGVLAHGSAEVRYTLDVRAGDRVALQWRRAGAEGFAPLLRISDEGGAVLAETAVTVAVDALRLTYSTPVAGTLIVTVARSESAASGSGGAYTLTVTVTPSDASPAAATPAPTVAPTAPPATSAPADYLAAPCQSEAQAVPALAQSAMLVDVYLAAGDSFYADQLTRTNVFAVDDDLNVVFLLQNHAGPADVAGLFCAPDGSFYDAGESSFEVGGEHLIGLDWEYLGTPWPAGDWYVELYVDDVLTLSVRFRVE